MIRPIDIILAAARCKHPQLTVEEQGSGWLLRYAAREARIVATSGESPFTVDGQVVAESIPEALELVELRLGLAGPVN